MELAEAWIYSYVQNPRCQAVLRIRIHRIHLFLGILDPDVKGSSKSNIQKNFFKFVFCWHLEGQ